MKQYIVYNEYGEILRSGICSDKSFGLQAREGEFIMEGVADDRTQKIVEGEVVKKEMGEIETVSGSCPIVEPGAFISERAWRSVLDRLDSLEGKK